MKDVHHFDINATITGQGSTILMDGQRLKCVRSISLDVGVDKLTTITLEVIGTAKLTGDAQVWVKNADEDEKPAEDDAEKVDLTPLLAPPATADAGADQ